jgi:short-subunit dehydrogenase
MSHHLSDSVVVITGASSGIGRAASRAFAQAGANVVLAARRKESLEEVAGECRSFGVQALALPTDTTDESRVRNLANSAISRFGHVDVWVNNAGVMAYGRAEDIPARVLRRVFETNVFGYFYGAQAILPHFKKRRRGILINVTSMVSKAGIAYMSPYVASKFALTGWSDCLRQELMLEETTEIHVCSVLPASIDTPLFQHAANYTGRQPKPVDPVYDPWEVAEAIVGCVEKPQREVYVGRIGPLTAFNRTMAPSIHDRVAANLAEHNQLQDSPALATEGNLFEPKEPASIEGGWQKPSSRGWKIAVAAAAVAVPLTLALGSRR